MHFEKPAWQKIHIACSSFNSIRTKYSTQYFFFCTHPLQKWKIIKINENGYLFISLFPPDALIAG